MFEFRNFKVPHYLNWQILSKFKIEKKLNITFTQKVANLEVQK